jgi:signal transduction histidine kinase
MDHFQKLRRQLTRHVFAYMFAANLLVAAVVYALVGPAGLSPVYVLLAALGLILLVSLFVSAAIANDAAEPVQALWQAVIHVSKNNDSVSPPQLERIAIGRDLVTSLSMQIYDLASSAPGGKTADDQKSAGYFAHDILSKFPLPVLVLDASGNLVFANEAASAYCRLEDPIGKSFNALFGLSYTTHETIDDWLKSASETRVTDHHTWEHVKMRLPNQEDRLCDIAAYYNKDNPLGYQTVLTMFDKYDTYDDEETGYSYIAMAVHELRTPLTIMRGYIEVFEDELEGKLTPELTDFMHKLSVSAQQLTSFISNILNVARIDEGAYQPKLLQEDWSKLLPSICNELELRAHLRNKQLVYDIEPDLPAVAVDRLSIYEVVANLVDNAIKYSGMSEKIFIHSHMGKDGRIETVIQDFGIGMPDNVVKQLFTKFYRNHRSKTQVAGSGLGLYLVKAIVSAHGGNVWVSSKEGEGSAFGFSLQTYEDLAEEQKQAGEQRAITHQAHGWIKNHSMNRR